MQRTGQRVVIARRAQLSPPLIIALACLCTYLLLHAAAADAACPNDSVRSGPSAGLPDCRAYELVTPQSSNGRIFSMEGIGAEVPSDLFATEPAGPFGNSLLFVTGGSPIGFPPGGRGLTQGDVYEAKREPAGWQTVRLVTPKAWEAINPFPGGVSSDHLYAFTHVGPVSTVAKDTDFGSLGDDADYLGDPAGNFELTGSGSLGTEKLAQGRYISPGGNHVIFSTGKQSSESNWCDIATHHSRPCPVTKLEPQAPPKGTGAIYDREVHGPTRVISLLPGDVTPAAGQNAAFQGASADGTVVAFKIGETIYVRIDDQETKEVTVGAFSFGGLSRDGTYLLYCGCKPTEAIADGDLHRFNTVTGEDEVINTSGDAELANVSADGSHVYFVSPSQLDGSKGTVGEPNLYLWHGGSSTFIATVQAGDLHGNPGLARWTEAVRPGGGTGPGLLSSRTTPDGSIFIFASRAQLDLGYDNAGHTEIYRYDAEQESTTCVSCNPDGTPATADVRLQYPSVQPSTIIHNLSEDGSKVFFEAVEPLVPGDEADGNDIYEWHAGEEGGPPALALITAGDGSAVPALVEAVKPNALVGISPDGSDVYFLSQDVLAPGAGEGGVPAIYDARVDGGFPVASSPSPCAGLDSCRPPAGSAPTLSSPASSVGGRGNVKPSKPRSRRCWRHRQKAVHSPRHCNRHKKG